ncbi:hypothetical protein [Dokdonella sp.]|uniref:hypothetical protein n=1 Tax=Dokdonella sp. TaxID=2291710 RepID=UPI0037843B25
MLRSPEGFPEEDFLPPDEQMTLDRAFEILRASLILLPVPAAFPAFHSVLATVLDESLVAYRAGDRKTGAHRLQDFQDLIFERPDADESIGGK